VQSIAIFDHDPLNADQTVVEIVGDWRGSLREGVPEEDLALEGRLSSGSVNPF